MSESGDPALIGRTIAGKFRVEKFLGGGAMGAVYLARQTALEKDVAVKVMHRAVAVDPQFAARFHREAKAASRLDHPNSMRVIDFGEEPDGLLYIAMEYLKGRDLYKVIHEDWPLSNERIADIMMQSLAAMAVAHDMGVIHRDLKPENIMILKGVSDDGHAADVVKVCDFGIAKITETEGSDPAEPPKTAGQKLTTAGLVVGTPEYMSPEQARGEKLDARSDIYSTGIILYQLLTGRVPFTAETALAIVLKHLTDPPESPRVIYPDVHRGLEAVCLKAMAKAREERYQSARDMRAALRAALDGKMISAPTPEDMHAPTLPLGVAITTEPNMPGSVVTSQGRSVVGPAMTAPATTSPTVAGVAAATPLGTEAAGQPKKKFPWAALAIGAIAVGGAITFVGLKYGPALHPSGHSKPEEPHASAKIDPTSPTSPTTAKITPDIPTTADTTNAPPDKNGKKAPLVAKKNGTTPAIVETPGATTAPPATTTAAPPPTQEPPPPATTVAPPPTAPPPPPPPAFDANTCKVATGAIGNNGATTSNALRLNGAPGAWTRCAKSGITSRPAGPVSATVTIRYTDSRQFRGATCAGCPGAMAACVAQAGQAGMTVSFGGDVTGDPAYTVPLTITCE